MAHDVFISYSTEDKPVADAVCVTLESRGIRCWVAPRDVLPGMDWGEAIIRAVTESRVMVLIFSSSANRSQQIKREVNQAIEKEIPIVPFRIENVLPSGSLEYYLDVTHWLDALTPPMENHIQQLAATVTRLLKRAGIQPVFIPPIEAVAEPLSPKPVRHKRLLIFGIIGLLALGSLAGVLLSRNWRGGSPAGQNQGTTVSPAPSRSNMNIPPDISPKPIRSTSPPVVKVPPTPQPAVRTDTCIQGYVWREASLDDHVCVTPETRARTLEDNKQAAARKDPKGGPYGPNTCLQGYVWREAFDGDLVCVPPETRRQAAEDNRQARARVVQ